jgi:MYXO-CTERM domain-containing protein
MRSLLLGAVAALGLCPAIASAAVTINLSPQGQAGQSNLTITPPVADQTLRIEVFGTDLDGSNERLNAYTIALQGAGTGGGKAFGDATGVRFSVPGSTFGTAGRPTDHPFVFKDLETIPPIENFSSTTSKLQFASTAVGQEDEVNVDPTHNGFIAAPLIIPAGAAPGVYTLSIVTTSLAGLGAPIVSTPGTPLTITIVPEPAAMGLVLVGGLFALRRRRLA